MEYKYPTIHWNENVVILMKFSSLAALEVVILTTFSAASDENFIKMKTFPFQCKVKALINKVLIHSLFKTERSLIEVDEV